MNGSSKKLITLLAIVGVLFATTVMVIILFLNRTGETSLPKKTQISAVEKEPVVPSPTAAERKVVISPTAALQPTEIQSLSSGAYVEQVKTAHGIEIHLKNIRHVDNLLKTDICFPLPDNEDWMLNQLSLQYDGIEVSDWGGIVIEPIIPAENGKPGMRCDMVYFSLPQSVSLSEFTITVISIWAPAREGSACQRANIVQQKLAQQGIQAVCQEGNGIVGYQIVDKPASMSHEEAQKILLEEQFFTIKGPWEFNIRLH